MKEVKFNEGKLPVAILNTSILTDVGSYKLIDVSLETAKELIRNNSFVSAVGHKSTSDILTSLLGVEVPVNRIEFKQQNKQLALIFKLNGRPEEGKILSIAEIETIGYKFQVLEKIN